MLSKSESEKIGNLLLGAYANRNVLNDVLKLMELNPKEEVDKFDKILHLIKHDLTNSLDEISAFIKEIEEENTES